MTIYVLFDFIKSKVSSQLRRRLYYTDNDFSTNAAQKRRSLLTYRLTFKEERINSVALSQRNQHRVVEKITTTLLNHILLQLTCTVYTWCGAYAKQSRRYIGL